DRNQRQRHRTRICHVSCGIEPVLKKEAETKGKRRGLALSKKVGSKQQWNQPLQDGASPDADGLPNPSEEKVAAFVNDPIGEIDEQKSAVAGECIEHEQEIEHYPRDSRPARKRPPRFVEPLQQCFKHDWIFGCARLLGKLRWC